MPGLVALVRDVSPAIGRCELTYLARSPIDIGRAIEEHNAYVVVLESLGCRIERLPSDDSMPDAVFIEDTAVVTSALGVITRPGAAARRAEVHAVREALSRYRHLVEIEAPGTLDGGDVVVAGRTVLVGRSSRTNDEGREQLGRALSAFGFTTRSIGLRDCLHLKSAVTALDDETLLVERRWVDVDALAGFDLVDVDAAESGAANVLRVGSTLVHPQRFPRTRAVLQSRGWPVVSVTCDELAKAEGAVTCCSLIVPHA